MQNKNGLFKRPSNWLLFLEKTYRYLFQLDVACAEKNKTFINMHNKCHDVN